MLSSESYKKMRKRRLTNFLIFYTFIILFICFNMTLSRYGSIGAVDSTMQVANWKIKINNEDMETSNTFLLTNVPVISTAQTVDNKIAPDSEGYFEIELDLTDTEVSVDYTLDIDTSVLVSNGINLEITGYSVNGGEPKTIQNNIISDSVLLNEVDGKRVKFTQEDKCNIKVYWKWHVEMLNPEFTKDELKIDVKAIIKQKIGVD